MIIIILLALIAAHCLCDFALQNEAMAIEKSRHSKSALQQHVPWPYWLISHSAIHGAAVALITHSIILGLFETVAHAIIDYFKCENKYGIGMDQMLHLLCKVAWVAILLGAGQ